MSEEIKKEASAAENKPSEVKKETAPKADAKPEETKKVEEKPANAGAEKPETKPEQKTAKAEKIIASNCVKCNKPIKKKMGYYRNGKYYCNKRCFKLTKVPADSQPS